jgi:hypothetical protein
MAFQGRERGSLSPRWVFTVPSMASAVTFPLYVVVVVVPLFSRSVLNVTVLPVTVPPEISALFTLPLRPGVEIAPVTVLPSTFSISVLVRSAPPFLPGVVQYHVPATLAASSALATESAQHASATQPITFINVPKKDFSDFIFDLSCSSALFPGAQPSGGLWNCCSFTKTAADSKRLQG